MPAGLLEIFSNTDWGRRLKEEKDKALSSAIMSLFNSDFKVPISTQTDITPTFQNYTQPSETGLGLLDINVLKSLLQPSGEKKRKEAYKQAALTMIGSALGGALAKALGASDEFAAGMAGGGYLMGQKLLEEQLAKEKAWQDFRNKLATKLIITNIDYIAEKAKDEEKRNRFKTYASLLREIYPKYCSDDGSFDWAGFSHEATIRALELGFDPKEARELQEAFFNASKTLINLERAKAQILESLARSALYGAQVEKTKAATEKTKKQTELLGKPEPPKVVVYRSEKEKGETGLSPAEERRILDRAIQLAQKDTRWLTAETEEERWELVRDYYNRLKELLGKPVGKSKKTVIPEEAKITGETLYKVLFGE